MTSAASARAVGAASIAAMATIAQFVVGKATRDALFLSHFPARFLPWAMIAGAALSAGAVLAQTALLRRRGPFAFVPFAFGVHALVALAGCALSFPLPRLAAVLVYLHTASFGPTLISAFWASVSEAFDPHTAKQVVGRIGAGATLGGIVGGGLAWLGARVAPVPAMLVLVALLSLVAARSVRTLGEGAVSSTAKIETPAATGSSDGATYLRWLAAIVLLGAIVQSLVEYALGAAATASMGSGPRLLAFFAVFQTLVGVMSFVLQLSVNRFALEKLGVGATLALLPGGIVVAGGLTLLFPSLLAFVAQRGAEGALRASVFRSAYEILFSPVAPDAKRRAKTIIDVGFDRLGMVAGSALTLAVIALWPHASAQAVTVLAVACAAGELLIVHRLQRGYVATLADRLRSGSLVLHPGQTLDATTRRTLSTTTAELDRDAILAQVALLRAGKAPRPAPCASPEHPELEPQGPHDERVELLGQLRSGNVDVVLHALAQGSEHLVPLANELVELLGVDAYASAARTALQAILSRVTGTVQDAILDEHRDLVVRRRAAELLGASGTQRGVDALVSGLEARELGVRRACAHALVRARGPRRIDPALVRELARRELTAPDDDRGHVALAFDLWSLLYPQEAMELAHAALRSEDPSLRGVALEYLAALLPREDREALERRLDAAPPAERTRTTAAALAELVARRDLLATKAPDSA